MITSTYFNIFLRKVLGFYIKNSTILENSFPNKLIDYSSVNYDTDISTLNKVDIESYITMKGIWRQIIMEKKLNYLKKHLFTLILYYLGVDNYKLLITEVYNNYLIEPYKYKYLLNHWLVGTSDNYQFMPFVYIYQETPNKKKLEYLLYCIIHYFSCEFDICFVKINIDEYITTIMDDIVLAYLDAKFAKLIKEKNKEYPKLYENYKYNSKLNKDRIITCIDIRDELNEKTTPKDIIRMPIESTAYMRKYSGKIYITDPSKELKKYKDEILYNQLYGKHSEVA